MAENTPESSGSVPPDILEKIQRVQALKREQARLRQENAEKVQRLQEELAKRSQHLETHDKLAKEQDGIDQRKIAASLSGGGGEIVTFTFESEIAPLRTLATEYLDSHDDDPHIATYVHIYNELSAQHNRLLVEKKIPRDPQKRAQMAQAIVGMRRVLSLAKTDIGDPEKPKTPMVIANEDGTFLQREARIGDALERSQEFISFAQTDEELQSVLKNESKRIDWSNDIADKGHAVFDRYKALRSAHNEYPGDPTIESIYQFCVVHGIRKYAAAIETVNGKRRVKRDAKSMAQVENSLYWLDVGLKEFESLDIESLAESAYAHLTEEERIQLNEEEEKRRALLSRLKADYKDNPNAKPAVRTLYDEQFAPEYNGVLQDPNIDAVERHRQLEEIIARWAQKMDALNAETTEPGTSETPVAKPKDADEEKDAGESKDTDEKKDAGELKDAEDADEAETGEKPTKSDVKPNETEDKPPKTVKDEEEPKNTKDAGDAKESSPTTEPTTSTPESQTSTPNSPETRERNEVINKAINYYIETVLADEEEYGGSIEWQSLQNELESTLLELWIAATDDAQYFPKDIALWNEYQFENSEGIVRRKFQELHAHILRVTKLYKQQRASFPKKTPYAPQPFEEEQDREEALRVIDTLRPTIEKSSLAGRYTEVETAYRTVYERNAESDATIARIALAQWKRASEQFAEAAKTAPKGNGFSGLFNGLKNTVTQAAESVTAFRPGMDPIEVRQALYKAAESEEFTVLTADQLEAVIRLRISTDAILGEDGRIAGGDDFEGDSLEELSTWGPILEKMSKAKKSKLSLVELATNADIYVNSREVLNTDTFDWMLDSQSSPKPLTGFPADTLIEVKPRGEIQPLRPEEKPKSADPVPEKKEKPAIEVAGYKLLSGHEIQFDDTEAVSVRYEMNDRESGENATIPLSPDMSTPKIENDYFTITRVDSAWKLKALPSFEGTVVLVTEEGEQRITFPQGVEYKELVDDTWVDDIDGVFADIEEIFGSEEYAHEKKLNSPAYKNFRFAHGRLGTAYQILLQQDPINAQKMKELAEHWRAVIDDFNLVRKKPESKKKPKLKPGKEELTSVDQYNKYMNSGQAFILKFEADWCSRCTSQTMNHDINTLSANYPVLIVKVEDYPEIARVYGADQSLPYVGKIRNGKVVQWRRDANPSMFISALDKKLESGG